MPDPDALVRTYKARITLSENHRVASLKSEDALTRTRGHMRGQPRNEITIPGPRCVELLQSVKIHLDHIFLNIFFTFFNF